MNDVFFTDVDTFPPCICPPPHSDKLAVRCVICTPPHIKLTFSQSMHIRNIYYVIFNGKNKINIIIIYI